MKKQTDKRRKICIDNEPVFCAETGKIIPSDPPSDVIPFQSEPRKHPLSGLESLDRTPTVDPGDDI